MFKIFCLLSLFFFIFNSIVAIPTCSYRTYSSIRTTCVFLGLRSLRQRMLIECTVACKVHCAVTNSRTGHTVVRVHMIFALKCTLLMCFCCECSDVAAGTELCWDYNYHVDEVRDRKLQCHCGALSCRGRLL